MLHTNFKDYDGPEECKNWASYADTPYEDPEIFTLPPTPDNLKAAQEQADAQAVLDAEWRAAIDLLEELEEA